MSEAGLITFERIWQIKPALCIGITAGHSDVAGLQKSGLHFHPKAIQPFGYMSYQAHHLVPIPVLELYIAELKVGEAMARMAVAEPTQAVKYAIEHSTVMDFNGNKAWL